MIVYGALLNAGGVPLSEIQGKILADPSYFGASIVLSLPIIIAGGYVTGRLAPGREMVHAFLMGISGIVVSAAMGALRRSPEVLEPAWFYPLAYILTIPSAMLGGSLARRTAARSGGKLGV